MIDATHQARVASTSTLSAAARTHPGLRRKQNEDDFVCDPESGLFAAIDGIGGEQGGEIAAARTREALLARPERGLLDAFLSANAVIRAEAEAKPALQGMGCVATAAKVRGALALIAHVGDTRAWLAGADGCQQLTRDHSAAAEAREQLAATGAASAEDAPLHAVTRDIGGVQAPGIDWADALEVPIQVGDLLVLASDGLHDVVPDTEILRLLDSARRVETSPEALVDSLIELALMRGGPDNVTVVVVRVKGAAQPVVASKAEIPVQPARRDLRTLAIASACVALVGLLLGVLVAGIWDRRAVSPRPSPLGEPEVTLMDGDAAGLSEPLMGRAVLVPRGPITLIEPLITEVGAQSEVDLVALELSVNRVGAWDLHVGAGATLRLVRFQPERAELDLSIQFDDALGRVELVGSDIELRSLTVDGPPGAVVSLKESRLSAEAFQGDRASVICKQGTGQRERRQDAMLEDCR